MEVISIIEMFMFGNMSDQNHQMTQYIPMESISKCMKEVRMLKKKKTEFDKDAFCGPAIVEFKDGEIIKLYNEIPAGATLVKKKLDKEAFDRWVLKAKEKWNKD